MATGYSRRCLLSLLAALMWFVLDVSASVTEKILQVPLFEVGELWLKAASSLCAGVLQTVTTVPDFTRWTTYVWIAAAVVVVYYGYAILVKPLNRVRKLGDLGYIAEGSLSVRDTANFVQKRRKVGSVPPVYPNGWFGIMESFYLQKGEAKPVSILGLNLAVFRDEKGVAHVLDAYCPHMGAHLAAGGRIKGDCLECPFHGWQFRGEDGKCTKIPYTEKIPDIAKVKSWPVKEVNGWIYLWHHADGIDPSWHLPEIEEIKTGDWVYRGRTEHYVNAHIEEVPENGADVFHLGQVHSPFILAGIDLRYMWTKAWSFAQHNWRAQWDAEPDPNGHIGVLRLRHNISVFGLRLPFFDLGVVAKQIGPGVVHLEFESIFGRGVFIQSLTPVEPLLQKMVHNIFATWYTPIPIVKFYLVAEALQVERDIMIWNNKQYESRPLFVKSAEDSLISRHRRWYSQFYTPNSPRLKFQKEDLQF